MKRFSIVMVTAILFMIFSTATTTIAANASSEGQRLAPGQWDESCGDASTCNHNPSGDYNPPGKQDQQDDMSHANPGQCQKYYSDPSVFDNGHDFAHDVCFD